MLRWMGLAAIVLVAVVGVSSVRTPGRITPSDSVPTHAPVASMSRVSRKTIADSAIGGVPNVPQRRASLPVAIPDVLPASLKEWGASSAWRDSVTTELEMLAGVSECLGDRVKSDGVYRFWLLQKSVPNSNRHDFQTTEIEPMSSTLAASDDPLVHGCLDHWFKGAPRHFTDEQPADRRRQAMYVTIPIELSPIYTYLEHGDADEAVSSSPLVDEK